MSIRSSLCLFSATPLPGGCCPGSNRGTARTARCWTHNCGSHRAPYPGRCTAGAMAQGRVDMWWIYLSN